MTSRFPHGDSEIERANDLPLTDEKIIDSNGEVKATESNYETPELFVVGKALNLIRSGSPPAKYPDGYSGYYWER
jgi:hypothetical protein